MAAYNVHAGHCPQGKGAYGAVGILQESVEDRIVKDEVIRLLRAEGCTVYDCTCDIATTKDGCLQKIVAKCNMHGVDLDISIHLNSGRNDYGGDGSTGGVEVYNYDSRTKDISDRICSKISVELGIRNRGTKYSKDLYVLNNTKSLALLVECCFVDDADDAARWDAKKCAKAIVEALLEKTVDTGGSGSSQKPTAPSKPNKPTTPNKPSGKINVVHQANAQGKGWQSEVWNYNTKNSNGYSGWLGKPIVAFRAKTKGDASTAGYLEYRAHRKGGNWYGWRRDYNKDSAGDTFAGDGKNPIDGLQMRLVGAPAGRQVRYRVHTKGKGWLGWITGYGSGDNGYAGWYGYAIDAVQVEII